MVLPAPMKSAWVVTMVIVARLLKGPWLPARSVSSVWSGEIDAVGQGLGQLDRVDAGGGVGLRGGDHRAGGCSLESTR